MANYQYMMSVDDVARELNCSKSHAYKLVKSMNKELASQGYITMAGRIPRVYWAKKMYGYESYHRGQYIKLLLEGKLNDHLHEVDGECYERMELLMEQMKAEAGITEELKTSDQMKWVGLMNNVRSSAEEIVLDELIYV